MALLSNENLIHVLDYMLDAMNLYLSLIIFIFGTVGNILNCLVLSQRTFHSNPCAFYFLISSIVNLISIIFGLTTKIMASWHLDPTETNNWICKIRVFIVFTSRTMGIWLIMLASIDRWLLSSRSGYRRDLSNIKIAKLGIIISFLLSNIVFIHMIYCYEANILDAPLKCYGKNITCRLITDLIYGLVTILIPLLLMILFSIMIISNIQHLRHRIKVVTVVTVRIPLQIKSIKLKRTDHHLLRMLLIQVLLLLIFCMPQALHKFYITFKSTNSMNNWQDALNHFLYNLDVILAFIASGMPFYLYTLADRTVFRRAFYELLQMFHRKIKCQ
ncbi:unnamed protein product [Rotaria sp. Silwood1]|nr:unnamed protein product [Rotaria sp. Silwood1]CAF1316271.1 unnamed protein product [Rotaria sp. Silwood1]CAF3488923.1 unnamed protein product [Rotaria sp. Silwood1]CAF4879884.1 unnamed protein product [Rotaria sp. Silwood1]